MQTDFLCLFNLHVCQNNCQNVACLLNMLYMIEAVCASHIYFKLFLVILNISICCMLVADVLHVGGGIQCCMFPIFKMRRNG